MKKMKKTAVKWVIFYLISTVGIWMFLFSYANSYNKLTDDKIAPAVLHTDENGIELEIIGKSFKPSLEAFEPESKLYFGAYLFMPEEMRILCTESAWKKILGAGGYFIVKAVQFPCIV